VVADGPRDVLVVDHLSKWFGDRLAVSDVSFRLEAGEVFGFLGPNGAGKTTTVRTLATLIEPTVGSAVVAGLPLRRENSVEIRQRISAMPENPGLYLRLTVEENLRFFAGVYGLRGPERGIAHALAAVNMSGRASDLCGGLSKGLRQRVGLARALLNDPQLLFLDEPTSGLDPAATREVHDLIDRLRQRGVTVFLTTHRLEEAERLCDRVAILNRTLRTIGRPRNRRANLFTATLLVRTRQPLPDPERLSAAVAGLRSWESDQPQAYTLTVTDPDAEAALVRA
jgi:ABC-2 type transport system ATP-binding protein